MGVVRAQRLKEPAIARKALIGDYHAVVRLSLLPYTSQPDTQHSPLPLVSLPAMLPHVPATRPRQRSRHYMGEWGIG